VLWLSVLSVSVMRAAGRGLFRCAAFAAEFEDEVRALDGGQRDRMRAGALNHPDVAVRDAVEDADDDPALAVGRGLAARQTPAQLGLVAFEPNEIALRAEWALDAGGAE
jgi:hypothetical protein